MHLSYIIDIKLKSAVTEMIDENNDVMLPLGWDFGSEQQCVQTNPWIFEEIHHLLVTG